MENPTPKKNGDLVIEVEAVNTNLINTSQTSLEFSLSEEVQELVSDYKNALENKTKSIDSVTSINSKASVSNIDENQAEIEGKLVIHSALIKLLTIARRNVLIILPKMHELFDDEQMIQAMLKFISYSPQRNIQVIINNLSDQKGTNHQLVRLAQRIPSRVQLKQTTVMLEAPVMENDYLVIADSQHILRIDNIERYHAWFDIQAASRAQQYATSMLNQWDTAQEILEFRQFTL